MNKAYYSQLDKIILRSIRRRMSRKCADITIEIAKFLLVCALFYGAFYWLWSLLCYVFPEW